MGKMYKERKENKTDVEAIARKQALQNRNKKVQSDLARKSEMNRMEKQLKAKQEQQEKLKK